MKKSRQGVFSGVEGRPCSLLRLGGVQERRKEKYKKKCNKEQYMVGKKKGQAPISKGGQMELPAQNENRATVVLRGRKMRDNHEEGVDSKKQVGTKKGASPEPSVFRPRKGGDRWGGNVKLAKGKARAQIGNVQKTKNKDPDSRRRREEVLGRPTHGTNRGKK